MAGLFDALGTATRGLQVVQRGLATAGHNIANAETPGYSRQRAVLQSAPAQPDATGLIGSGVEQVSIERIIDRFVGLRLINETSRRASLETESSIYREVESVVNDQLANGLTSKLTGFFDALDDLANAAEPGQGVARGQVLAAAETLVDTVQRVDSQLRGLQRDADRGITAMLPEINSITSEIARLNGEIAEAEAIAPANDLRDQRDRLVLDLAEKFEIVSSEDEDGMVAIRLAGGVPLVSKRIASELVAVVDPADLNAFDPTFSQVHFRGSGSSFDATSLLKGGELGGLIEARDGIIAGVIRDLDAVVFTLSESFNSVHRGGLGLDDGAAHDFFTDLSGQTTVDDSARNFGIAADIDPDQGGSLGNIAAGAVPNPVTGGPEAAPGDTAWVEELKNLRTLKVTNYLAGDTTGSPTGSSISVMGRLVNVVGDIGQNARSTSRALEQQEAVLSSLQDRRDSISGVSIDEEVANLVQLQANFQANARVVTTVNFLMQALLDAL
ncbi:MAG TPA: flagellar hook-associated protein FlgK [Deltaproteobacteria bacterium]|nr:flagellar hook-associated protein FlgK [Deltaproteobacteria bacterium]